MKPHPKTAFLADIHGNLQALESVFKDLDAKEVQYSASLGDVVGYGGHPNECLNLVRTRCRYSIYGNIYAGEIIFLLLWMWAATGVTGAIFGGTLALLWAIFHILIVGLQAYIFMMLTVVYIAMAHEHH